MRNVILILAALGLGCSSPASEPAPASSATPSPHTAAPSAAAEPSPTAATAVASNAGGISWNAPAPFVARPPSSRMRAAEYVVEGDESALMTVFYFGAGQGGSVQANVDRWVGQMQQPDGRSSQDVAEVSTRTIGDIDVTIVDVSGTYNAGMMGAPSATPQADRRMLGAIAEGPQGPIFFRLVGSVETLARAQDAFDSLVASFTLAPAS